MAFYIVIVCIVVYFVISLLTRKHDTINLAGKISSQKGMAYLVTTKDKILIRIMVTCVSVFIFAFIGIGIYNLYNEVSLASWMNFWKVFIVLMFMTGTAFLAWITIGGVLDLRKLFTALKCSETNELDDGRVEEQKSV